MEDSCTPRSNYKGQMVGVITVMGLSNANQLVGFLLLITSSSALAAAQAPSSPFSTLSPLRALVPLKTGFTEFVSWSGSPQNATFNGFSVQVFEMAVQRLPFSLPYKLVPFGDGKSNPSYNDMVHMLAQGEADAIVADLTINNERLRMVDFTQPYMQSALMMVTPFKYGSIGTLWDFLQPFSMELWFAIMVAFFGTGFVMFILEHKNPDFHQSQTKPPIEFDDDDRPPAHATTFQYRLTKSVKRLVNVYWFTSLTVFFSQQESVTTHAGRFVTVVWLLVVLIFTSSYTASLASTLSAEQPYPTIQGFAFLLKSDVPIGYQGGSFIENYLTMLGVQKSRLKALSTEDQYANALKMGTNGGVAAIIDEMPYVQSFLSTQCDFTTVGDQISYFGGFGFAFAKNSSLTDEVSLAILSLVQDGSLQRLNNLLVGTSQCSANAQATSHMRLRSFGGLFIILGAVYGLCVTWRVLTWQVKSATRIGSMMATRTRSPPPAAGSAGHVI